MGCAAGKIGDAFLELKGIGLVGGGELVDLVWEVLVQRTCELEEKMNLPLATYESLFSPIVLRAERSNLRFNSGGMPNRKTASPMTAKTPARAVKNVVALIVRVADVLEMIVWKEAL